MHPEVASEFWRRIREAPCARELTPLESAWLELFAAVGARDAAGIRKTAATVLDGQRGERNAATEYAFIAAVTAALKQGDAQSAMTLLELGPAQWLRPGKPRRELGYLFSLAASARAR